jgi:hypothetical protein
MAPETPAVFAQVLPMKPRARRVLLDGRNGMRQGSGRLRLPGTLLGELRNVHAAVLRFAIFLARQEILRGVFPLFGLR